MKKAFTMLMAAATLAGSDATPAAPVPMVRFCDDAPFTIERGQPYNVLKMMDSRKQVARKAAARDASQSVTLTLHLDMDWNEYYLQLVQMKSADDGAYGFVMNGDDKVELTAAPGTYTLIVPFSNIGVAGAPGYSYVILENIELDGDKELTVSPYDATEVITFKSVLPDGSEPKLPTSPTSESDNVDKTHATVNDMETATVVSSDELGSVFVSVMNQVKESDDGLDGLAQLNFAVTPLGENWHFSQTRCMMTPDNKYYMTHTAVNGSSQTPAVNAPEFIEYEYDFAENPGASLISSKGSKQGYCIEYMVNGCIDTMGFILYGRDEYRYFLAKPTPADTPTYSTGYGLYVAKVDVDRDIVYDWGAVPDIRALGSPIVVWDDATDELSYLYGGSWFAGSPLWWVEDGSDPQAFPGNPNFASTPSAQKYALGAAAPVCEGLMTAYEAGDGKYDLYFSASYQGLYGEPRWSDTAFTTAFITTDDGKETVCDYDEVDSYLRLLNQDGRLAGKFSIELDNDLNVAVDDIAGYNISVSTVQDGAGKDVVPPTVTMLQLRNTSGEVDNRFDSADQGELLFTGGDFSLIEGRHSYWECAPADVKVEYAPAEGEDFKELAVEEVPENYSMPYFGHFWKSSLKDVEGKSENGWFKLRVTLTDAAGNSQEQTMWPAFYIKDSLGVESAIANDASAPEYFNLQGMRLARPESGSLVIRRQGGTVSKILVK